MEVRNCPECGRVFTFIRTNLCPECQKKDDEDFRVVRAFIARNPGAHVSTVSEQTGISEKKIFRFIKEGRIEAGADRVSGPLACEVCGIAIPAGRLCKTCSDKLSSGLKKSIMEENKKAREEMKKGPRMHTAELFEKRD
ncbi:MAG: flagellar protein [Peptococcaceae bacterium]|jgi:flagellar operon protein (TIGR03826 family)|nr:flagellar protein [Peptococcaceae bacterium]MDH7524785.1 flagellar protein [Peptococcaceae bacterium]